MRFLPVNCSFSVLPFFSSQFLLIWMTGLLAGFIPAQCVLRLPEFAEPIKNETLPVGSDVEFSCDVRYLGTYRVAWVWNKENEQRFLSIGVVKITSNPRVHITRLQKSDDMTQFNLYIYNIKKDDCGTYHCTVNSNPMISQIGTLDVTGDVNEKAPEKEDPLLLEDLARTTSAFDIHTNSNKQNSPTEPLSKSGNNTPYDPCLNDPTSCGDANDEDVNPDLDNNDNITSYVSIYKNSTLFCVDLNDVWENARERISGFISTLVQFSYSYWFS